MARHLKSGFIFGLLLGSCALQFSGATLAHQPRQQALTPAPNGPYHVQGNQILDSTGHTYLMRGTQLTPFHLQTAAIDAGAAEAFGAHSATSLSAIRLRFNMNTVRLPLDISEAGNDHYFAELATVVNRANRIDLLVVLVAREPGAPLPTRKTLKFWSRCASVFKDNPNVMFDAFMDPVLPFGEAHSKTGWDIWRNGDGRNAVGMEDLVRAIRAAGARQPVAVMSWSDDRLFEGAGPGQLIDDANVIYEVSPRYSSTRTDAERDVHFGFLASQLPVVASGWDLRLDDLAECAFIPSDPSAAAELVQANLDYFDAHQISWTASVFEPGKLVKDLSLHDATSLENGWTCGHPVYPYAGLGRVVEGHLRSNQERGLFVVSASGGPDIARGGFALAYGPVMAERDTAASGPRLPTTLGRISVQVTDSRGVSRPAGMIWASEGWGQTNFVVPQESAVGPAQITLLRADGSRLSANITIAETAPGFMTGHSCRGPALGSATQVFRDGRKTTSDISACKGMYCSTIAIPVSNDATTRLQLRSSGFRHAESAAKIEVTIGGVKVPVVSFGAADDRGLDQLTVEVPSSLRGIGETDLICHVNGRVSNAVLVRL